MLTLECGYKCESEYMYIFLNDNVIFVCVQMFLYILAMLDPVASEPSLSSSVRVQIKQRYLMSGMPSLSH